jgi:hypothetical protein
MVSALGRGVDGSDRYLLYLFLGYGSRRAEAGTIHFLVLLLVLSIALAFIADLL